MRIPYAKALLVATPASQLVDGKKPPKLTGFAPEQMTKMEREMTNLPGQCKMVERTYGRDVLNLVLVKGYIGKLLENKAVGDYLRQHQSDLLSEFTAIIDTVSIEQPHLQVAA